MDAIHFTTEVGPGQTLRVPEGITLPQGLLEVTVVPALMPAPSEGEIRDVWDGLLEMGAEAEKLPTEPPADMAENHDFYARGAPRK